MEHDSIHDGWAVGPPPNRAGRKGAVLALIALVAGFLGGVGTGFVLDDGDRDDAGVVAAVGPPEDLGSSSASEHATATTAVAIDGPMHSGPPERTRVFRRDTPAGSLRVFLIGVADSHVSCGPRDWCPPPECFPTSYVEATVVGEWEISMGGGPLYSVLDGTDARVLGLIANSWPGADESVFGAVVRTSDTVQAVRLRDDAAGVRDEMTPLDNIAVVAVPSTGTATDANGLPANVVFEVVRADGTTTELPLSWSSQQDPACIPPPPPPPTLPAPGEQPADAESAEAAVRDRFAAVFGGEDEALETGVDDPVGLREIRDRLREQYPTQSEPGGVTYEVAELVFTSPDAAVYQFRPIVLGNPLPWKLGNVRLIDGDWKITRGTVCAMYAHGGPSC